jgi:hypothetical protein
MVGCGAPDELAGAHGRRADLADGDAGRVVREPGRLLEAAAAASASAQVASTVSPAPVTS